MIQIDNKNKEVILAVYGTLRRGQTNYNWLLKNKAEYLGTTQTEPIFTMFGKNSGFPIVVDKGNTPITIELFRVEDPDVLRSVHRLEGCSGIPGHESNWYDIIPITTKYGKSYMYVMHKVNRKDIIESGNWLKK